MATGFGCPEAWACGEWILAHAEAVRHHVCHHARQNSHRQNLSPRCCHYHPLHHHHHDDDHHHHHHRPRPRPSRCPQRAPFPHHHLLCFSMVRPHPKMGLDSFILRCRSHALPAVHPLQMRGLTGRLETQASGELIKWCQIQLLAFVSLWSV